MGDPLSSLPSPESLPNRSAIDPNLKPADGKNLTDVRKLLADQKLAKKQDQDIKTEVKTWAPKVQTKEKESKTEKLQYLLAKTFDGLNGLKNSFGNFCAIDSAVLKGLTSLR